MPTMGLFSGSDPVEPKKPASPRANTSSSGRTVDAPAAGTDATLRTASVTARAPAIVLWPVCSAIAGKRATKGSAEELADAAGVLLGQGAGFAVAGRFGPHVGDR